MDWGTARRSEFTQVSGFIQRPFITRRLRPGKKESATVSAIGDGMRTILRRRDSVNAFVGCEGVHTSQRYKHGGKSYDDFRQAFGKHDTVGCHAHRLGSRADRFRSAWAHRGDAAIQCDADLLPHRTTSANGADPASAADQP